MTVLLLVTAMWTQAAEEIVVELADGLPRRVSWVAIEKDLVMLTAGDKFEKIALTNILSIQFQSSPTPAWTAPVALFLHGGGLLRLQSVESDAKTASVILQDGAELDIPLSSLAAVLFQVQEPKQIDTVRRGLATIRSSDLIVAVRDGEEARLEGLIGSMGTDRIHFTLDGEDIPVRRERIREIVFATPAAPPKATFTLLDTQGNVWPADQWTRSDNRFQIAGALLGKKTFSADDVVRIDYSPGRIVYLSDLEPALVEHVPFFDQVWEYRRDESFAAAPIRVDGAPYPKGLVLHSKTRLTYDLHGDYQRFSSRVGIEDGAGNLGQAQVRVLVDDKVIWEAVVRAKEKSITLDLPIPKGQRLSLDVDVGPFADLGDHVAFADAKLLK